MLRYVIVGSGYRSEYFSRIAHTYPQLFSAMFLCRSEEKAKALEARTGTHATCSRDACLQFHPDFVIIAVDKEHVADVAEEWIMLGFPVVTETPVGASMHQLERLWTLQEKHQAKIVCCEQYHRHPVLQEGISAIQRGLIGTPISTCLSLVHDYHAMSLLRRMLMVPGEAYTLRGMTSSVSALHTDSRQGPVYSMDQAMEETTSAFVTFASGKTAIYDFTSMQYRSFIRTRHLTVRGTHGEWHDRAIYHMNDAQQPARIPILSVIPERYRILDTQTLSDLRKTCPSELFLSTAEDEYAIATILLDMECYLAGGPSPYPLWEALDDAVFSLMLEALRKKPWEEIYSPDVPWRTSITTI